MSGIPLRAVRVSDEYVAHRRWVYGFGLAVVLAVVTFGWFHVRFLRDLLHEGVRVPATLTSHYEGSRNDENWSVNFKYTVGGQDYYHHETVEPYLGKNIVARGGERLLILEQRPENAWFGPLTEEDVARRRNLMALIASLCAGLWAGIAVGLFNQAQRHSEILRNWIAVDATVEKVEVIPGKYGGIVLTLGFDLGDKRYQTTQSAVDSFEVDQVFRVWVNPQNPAQSARMDEPTYAEIVREEISTAVS